MNIDVELNAQNEATLVGYGRYGGYIGPKYAKEDCQWNIEAVVDPAITLKKLENSVLGRLKPNTKLFKDCE